MRNADELIKAVEYITEKVRGFCSSAEERILKELKEELAVELQKKCPTDLRDEIYNILGRR